MGGKEWWNQFFFPSSIGGFEGESKRGFASLKNLIPPSFLRRGGLDAIDIDAHCVESLCLVLKKPVPKPLRSRKT